LSRISVPRLFAFGAVRRPAACYTAITRGTGKCRAHGAANRHLPSGATRRLEPDWADALGTCQRDRGVLSASCRRPSLVRADRLERVRSLERSAFAELEFAKNFSYFRCN